MLNAMATILTPILGIGTMVKDNTAVLAALKASSGLRWTAPRPGMLKESASGGTLKAVPQPPNGGISFVDLAAFHIEMLQSTEFDGKAPFVSY